MLGSLLVAALIACVATLVSGAEDASVLKARKTRDEAAFLADKIKVDVDAAIKSDARRDEDTPFSVMNKFFLVQAIGRSTSEGLLKKAEEFRKNVPVKNLTIIHVEITDDSDEELIVLLCGKGRTVSGAHRVWITASSQDRVVKLLEEAVATITLGRAPDKKTPLAPIEQTPSGEKA